MQDQINTYVGFIDMFQVRLNGYPSGIATGLAGEPSFVAQNVGDADARFVATR